MFIHISLRKLIDFGLPDRKWIFLILRALNTIITIGDIIKKMIDEYLFLISISLILETRVVPGIKKHFITSIRIINTGTLNHHKLTMDLSFAFEIAIPSISSCFN
jgi:hypothetical protein